MVVAVAGIAIIVWNLRDKIADLWSCIGFSSAPNSATVSDKSSSEALKSSGGQEPSPTAKFGDVAPESVGGSSEKMENPVAAEQPPKEIVGNSAPESTEKPTTSVYVGLPKADPATVSASIQPPNWPGATPR